MKHFYLILIFSLFSNSIFCQSEGLSLIKADELMKTVTRLSAKEMKGRLAGGEGYDKAANYIADEFKKLNLKTNGDKGYFQNFNVEYNEINSCSFKIYKGKETKELELGEDYVCRVFSGSGNVKASVVFCGYGLSLPEQNYDDYAGIDVKGKIVMVFKQNPSWKLNNKEWEQNYPRDKARLAAKNGAMGMIIISRPNDKEPQKPIASAMEGENEQLENFPVVHLELSKAYDCFEGKINVVKLYQTFIDSIKKPVSVPIANIEAEIKVDAKYFKNRNTKNIVGILEGSDPLLKNEYIVVSAHLDHVGEQAGKIYFPGANDNASGSACVLQLARAMEKEKKNLKRSFIFVLFACEEHGLDGSKFFAEHPGFKYENIVAQLNLDCVGYGDSIQLGNGKSSPVLWKLANIQDSLHTRRLVRNTWDKGGADLTPLYEKAVPGIYFVTTKSYAHLHLTTDIPETLNQQLFEKVCKLAFLTAFQIAEGNYKRETVVIQKK